MSRNDACSRIACAAAGRRRRPSRRPAPPRNPVRAIVLRPAQSLRRHVIHDGWAVRVRGERIEAAGPPTSVDISDAEVIDLPGTTLLPGLIEGHSHILLHPYNETSWNDQVLKESAGVRVARATTHLRQSCWRASRRCATWAPRAPAYADAELKQAVEQGIVPGPRLLVTTAPSSPPAATAPKATRSTGACRRALKRPTTTRWCASCATRSATAPTG